MLTLNRALIVYYFLKEDSQFKHLKKKQATALQKRRKEDFFPLLLTSYFYNLERKIHCRNWLESFVENLELLLAI